MTVDLSAFYFDIRKDSLYCDAWSSLRRRSCRTAGRSPAQGLTAQVEDRCLSPLRPLA